MVDNTRNKTPLVAAGEAQAVVNPFVACADLALARAMLLVDPPHEP